MKKRAWIGLALLAGSWLFGLEYYRQSVDWLSWLLLVVTGTLLLADMGPRQVMRSHAALAFLLLLPAIWIAPWPYRGALLLMAMGLLPTILPSRLRWLCAVGRGALTAGLILLVQALTLLLYAHLTARSHDLPGPLVDVVNVVARCLGIESAGDGSEVLLHSMRRTHRFAASWDFFFDPVTACFLTGGIAFLLVRTMTLAATRPVRLARRAVLGLLIVVALWLPVRCALQLGVFQHRSLITDYDNPLILMNQFWYAGIYVLLLIGPVLLAWRLVHLPVAPADETTPASSRPTGLSLRRAAALALAVVAVATFVVGLYWQPRGEAKAGRVLVDEYHSEWERTDKPMDTEWYGHMSSYNYACIYDYASRFYEMGRITSPMDDAMLSRCDVLIVKTPTARYQPAEVAAIQHFVEHGGGLMLIGEHTDVFHVGEHLNDLARPNGFTFRYDCLFGLNSPFRELYRAPLMPHPIVQYMPPLDFEISCSIDPGASSGETVMQGTGLYSLPADYHASNYYPQVEDRPDARYGAWIQMWATTRGAGRIVAFTDSTQFSNFSTFEPGKPEEFLGMIDWLNHRGGSTILGLCLVLSALVMAALGIYLVRGWPGAWMLVLSAGLLGWSAGVVTVRTAHAHAFPAPTALRPMVQVVMDRTTSSVELPVGGFIAGKQDGFGIFDRWILRLGYFTTRRSGSEAFSGQLLVVLHPDKPVPEDFRQGLQRYIESGGKLLVVDSPQNRGSTANSLLYPFGLGVDRTMNLTGTLRTDLNWPAVPISAACTVRGGQPFAFLGDKPIGAVRQVGKGSVTVLGFGSRFTDVNMGVTGDLDPDPALRKVYEVEYSLFRRLINTN